MQEEKALLAEIKYLSSLIENHKKQNVCTQINPCRKEPTRIVKFNNGNSPLKIHNTKIINNFKTQSIQKSVHQSQRVMLTTSNVNLTTKVNKLSLGFSRNSKNIWINKDLIEVKPSKPLTALSSSLLPSTSSCPPLTTLPNKQTQPKTSCAQSQTAVVSPNKFKLVRIVKPPAESTNKVSRRLVLLKSSSTVKPKQDLRKQAVKCLASQQSNLKTSESKHSRYKWSPNNTSSSLRTDIKRAKNKYKFTTSKMLTCSTNLLKTPLLKTVRTKFKLIRGSHVANKLSPKSLQTKYKIINVSKQRQNVKKVKKFSVRYITPLKTSTPNYRYGISPVSKTIHHRKSPFSSKKNYVWKKLLTNKTKSCQNNKVANISSKLIMIGGIFYNSSRMKLSRTQQNSPIQPFKSALKIKKLNPKKAQIVSVRGIRFIMDPSGKTLKRLNVPETTPTLVKGLKVPSITSPNLSRVDLGRQTYIETQPGVLTRTAVNQTRTLASQAVNRSIYRLVAAKKRKEQYCMFFNKFGHCKKKESGSCPYKHDPDKVAVCTRFLQGSCDVKDCPFSHKRCRSKMPVCSFFLQGRCNSDNCPYLHVNVNPQAEICKDFLNGYCSHGEQCKKRHILTCPEFRKTGSCSLGKKCPLRHIKAKAKKRKNCDRSQDNPKDSIVHKDTVSKSETVSELVPANSDDNPPSPKRSRLPSFILIKSEEIPKASDEPAKPKVVEPIQIKPRFLLDM